MKSIFSETSTHHHHSQSTTSNSTSSLTNSTSNNSITSKHRHVEVENAGEKIGHFDPKTDR